MGWNDHLDRELSDSLSELISAGFLFEGGMPCNVAKKIIEEGLNGLDDEERRVFDDELLPALRALEEARSESDAGVRH